MKRRATYRLYPTKAQEVSLLDIKGGCQRLYNGLLEHRKLSYERQGETRSFAAQCRDITALRAEMPEYAGIYSQVLQGVAKRVDLAFSAFFRRVEAGQTAGYPRFKSFHRYNGWDYKQYGKGWRLFIDENKKRGSLKLHGVGEVKLKGSTRVVGGEPKTCTLQHKNGRWHASVVYEYTPEQLKRESGTRAMGLDWGCEKFLTIATEDHHSFVPNPRHLRRASKKLAREQRRLARKKKRSRNRRKQIQRVASAYGKVARRRHDFHHKTSTLLVRSSALIAVEALNVKGMTAAGGVYKKGLNKSILDGAPAAFHAQLEYKAEEAGVEFVVINTRKVKPSQTCSRCGHQQKKSLACRTHRCTRCAYTADRDVNAAQVILHVGLHGTVGHTGAVALATTLVDVGYSPR
jgi:putative transposase